MGREAAAADVVVDDDGGDSDVSLRTLPSSAEGVDGAEEQGLLVVPVSGVPPCTSAHLGLNRM